MVYLSGQLKIVCRGGDAVKLIKTVFCWIRKLFLREKKQLVPCQIQVVNSTITINIIHKD